MGVYYEACGDHAVITWDGLQTKAVVCTCRCHFVKVPVRLGTVVPQQGGRFSRSCESEFCRGVWTESAPMRLREIPYSPRFNLSKRIAALVALTCGALFIHGYHPWAEDAEIYLPGVEKIIHGSIFPSYQEFFQFHAHLTLFPNLVATSLWMTRLPFEWGLFLWQFASVFLLLLASWQVSRHCFAHDSARWAGVARTGSGDI